LTPRKKLIEVGLPLVAINAESAREKSIRHGHPSTLHLWWARRPLAACRAVLFASLVDDPDSDPQYLRPNGKVDEETAGSKRADLFNFIEELVMWENSNNPDVIRTARAEIARCVASRLIETGVLKKDAAVGPSTTAYDLVTRGHCRPVPRGVDKKVGRVRFSFDISRLPPAEDVNAFLAEHAPPVLDPFAGGGSIPLEAQRLGLRAYASDLNPVAVLINKALIEIPPKFAGRPPVNPEARGEATATNGKRNKQKGFFEKKWLGAAGLAEDVRYYGKWMRDEAEKRIGHLYPRVTVTAEIAEDRPDLKPRVGQKLTVIAWLWARTVASPNPACGGAHTPLVRSFWLSTKPDKEAYAQPIIDRKTNAFSFRVGIGRPTNGFDPANGTVNRRGGRCLLTGDPMPFPHIRGEGQSGRIKVRLMAIVAEGSDGRVYLPPDNAQVEIAQAASPMWRPEAEFPNNPRDFKTPNYGMTRFADIFTARQLSALTTFSDLVAEARIQIRSDLARSELPEDHRPLAEGGSGAMAYADAVAAYLAFAVDKVAEGSTTLCTWSPLPTKLHVVGTFGRQALPMVWDFAEANVFAESSGNFERMVGLISEVLDRLFSAGVPPGKASQIDATELLSIKQEVVVSTDPPYYDNIGYADLSDFAYVWLRRSLNGVFPTLFATLLTPKKQELIASPYRHDGNKEAAKSFFEHGLVRAFSHMRAAHSLDVPLTVFYAFRQSENDEADDDSDVGAETESVPVVSTGWETMLEGVSRAGFMIDGTWPVRTERSGGFRNFKQNALASSVVLVCRPRRENASLTTRKDLITALRGELPEALRNLQRGNIAPVDLAQAAIGPGMAIFTRYAKVMESDGSPMTVRTSLGIINQVLDEVLAEQEGEFDADTRWALAWFEQYGTQEGPFGVAETLSKAKNTAINGLVEAGVVKAKGGKVQLTGRSQLPKGWDPTRDKRLTVWETTQHLIRALENDGEPAAATMMNKLGGLAEIARDLAYRLYAICERKKWAEEALAYNGLVIAWPELTKLARSQGPRTRQEQGEFF